MAVSVPVTKKDMGANSGLVRTTSLDSCDIKNPVAQTLPNYLRASIGSCHDFCKFGRRRDLTVEIKPTKSGTPPLSPNTTRSNYLKKRNNLLSSSSGSPSTVRSPVHNVIRAKEIQQDSKKLEATARSPRKLATKPLEKKGFSNRIWNYGGNTTSKQIESPRGSKKSPLLPKTISSLSQKPDLRKVQKKTASSKAKDTKKTDSEQSSSVEDIPEKILFVTEVNSDNNNNNNNNKAAGFRQEENVCVNSLECQRNNDSSLQQNTEDESFIDKEIDPIHFSSSPKGISNDSSSQSHERDKNTASSLSLSSSSADENETINVILRHQHVESRVADGLLNKVIEQTTANLSKIKDNKVKNLVDAFESVILYQDLSLEEQLNCGESPKFPLCEE